MTGIINFFREDWGSSKVVGKLFYIGGESIEVNGISDNLLPVSTHYLTCSDPDISPFTCDECQLGVSYSDGSFVDHEGDAVYNIHEVETALLEYYNTIAPSGWDQAAFRPYRWKIATNKESPTKYKTVKMMVDKDHDVWYIIVELKEPIIDSSNYIDKLQKHFEDD